MPPFSHHYLYREFLISFFINIEKYRQDKVQKKMKENNKVVMPSDHQLMEHIVYIMLLMADGDIDN